MKKIFLHPTSITSQRAKNYQTRWLTQITENNRKLKAGKVLDRREWRLLQRFKAWNTTQPSKPAPDF